MKVIKYCFSKAFDFFPRFLTYVALLLLTGKREEELLGLAWKQLINKKSNLINSGTYLLSSKIFKYLNKKNQSLENEIIPILIKKKYLE